MARHPYYFGVGRLIRRVVLEEEILLPELLLGVASEGVLLRERNLYLCDIKISPKDDSLVFTLGTLFCFCCCDEGTAAPRKVPV